jgi:hypothetical protein
LPVEGHAPEPSETLRKVWSEPGGEAHSYRHATKGAGGEADDHSDAVAAETPETHEQLSDPTPGPRDKDATGEAIERMRRPAKGR